MDVPFLLLTLLLTGVGLIMLFSASFPMAYYEGVGPAYYLIRQGIFAAIGVALMLAIGRINYERYRVTGKYVLAIAVFLLLLVLVPGVGRTVNGATRWLGFGELFTFQPSEIAKIGVILYFSDSISKKKEKMRTFQYGILPYAVILGAIAVLMYFEPHLSGTVLILGIGAVLMFAGGIEWKWVVAGMGVAAAGIWAYLTGKIAYNAKRITIWRDPLTNDQELMRDAGYQMRQSLLAIGSGGLLGVGLGKSRQKFMYLPERHNDFIFAIICEELGLIGATLIMALFALLIIRGYWIALHARDRFGALLAVGVTTQVALQVFLNIAVVTNLIPNTGISLPFFSYGGTALVIQLAEMGLVLSVSRQMPAN
ncbi:MAG: putative lipid II flippase FtsW [Oscillospiraceae bacterium]|nr:putative lipid II flippase FtsW [Oscillospiraceae bacterium]